MSLSKLQGSFILALLIFLAGCCASPPPDRKPPQKKDDPKTVEEAKREAMRRIKEECTRFTILHTNDFHGQMLPITRKVKGKKFVQGGAAHLAAYLEKARQEAQKNNSEVLLLDAGDIFQGTPEGNLTKGRLVVEFMNEVGYEAMAIGNHEYDFSEKVVKALKKQASFPFLSANLLVKETNRRPDYATPYIILKRRGFKIAVVGLTTSELHHVTARQFVDHLKLVPEVPLAAKVAKMLRKEKKADVVIFLTHCGYETDKEVARSVPEIDFIIGGHSHTRLETPYKTGGRTVVQAGDKGRYVGKTEFWIHPKNRRILHQKYELVPITPKWGESKKITGLIDKYRPKIEKVMGRVIGENKYRLKRFWGRASAPLGNLLADAMKEAANVQIAFQNKGGIRSNLPAGKITYREVYKIAPFGNSLVKMELTGQQLKEIFHYGLKKGYPLEVAGATCKFKLTGTKVKPGVKILEVLVEGQPVIDDKLYSVVTNSFVANGGDGFATFVQGKKKVDTGMLYREALARYIKKNSPLQYKYQNRYPYGGKKKEKESEKEKH